MTQPTHNPAAAVERERRRVASPLVATPCCDCGSALWCDCGAPMPRAKTRARLSAWTAGEYAGER